jgi:hypothetical protein
MLLILSPAVDFCDHFGGGSGGAGETMATSTAGNQHSENLLARFK